MYNSHAESNHHEQMVCNLEIVKTLRPKLLQLESLKAKILHEIETFKAEQSYCDETKRELCILQNERKLHMEAVEAINQDVEQLQASILQTKHEKEVIKSRAIDLIQELKPLKVEVDAVRFSIGLEKLPDMMDVDEAVFNT